MPIRRLPRSLPIATVVLLFFSVLGNAAPPQRLARTGRYAPDHLIVKYKSDASEAQRKVLQARFQAEHMRTFRSSGMVLLKLAPGKNVDDVIGAFRKNPHVAYVQRDHYLSIHQTFPNDTDFDSLWGLNNVGQTGGTLHALHGGDL